jgi:hypothetical protein
MIVAGRTRLTIIVSSKIAAVPKQGGWTWLVLQYVLGLRRLGHEVIFLESLDPKDIRPAEQPFARSENAAYFRRVTREHGLASSSCLLLTGTQDTVGLSFSELRATVDRADALLNLSGVLRDEMLVDRVPVRIYLDLDPGFTQLWSAVQGIDMNFSGHTHFVTIGLGVGQPTSRVPLCDLPWITTPQPIVLSEWPVAQRVEHDALTTIANWRGYGSVEHEGRLYGQKVHSLREFISLPLETDEKFLLALAIHPDEVRDLEALRSNGWELTDPMKAAGSPGSYRRFIQGSRGELGIAKSGYVAADCGWFSDRSICYLASGRPVIAQETGFSRYFPTGEGLFAFTSIDDVLLAISAVRADYARHARAARAIAEEYFDSDRVLLQLLEATGVV